MHASSKSFFLHGISRRHRSQLFLQSLLWVLPVLIILLYITTTSPGKEANPN